MEGIEPFRSAESLNRWIVAAPTGRRQYWTQKPPARAYATIHALTVAVVRGWQDKLRNRVPAGQALLRVGASPFLVGRDRTARDRPWGHRPIP